MKLFIRSGVMIIIMLSLCVVAIFGDSGDIVESCNTFTFDMFHSIQRVDQDKNVFISPYNMYKLLSILKNGADDVAAEEISKVLHNEIGDISNLNDDMKHLRRAVSNQGEKVVVTMANSLWVSDGISLCDKYVNDIKKYYDTEVYYKSFNDIDIINSINDWAKKNTHGMIREIIDGINPYHPMILFSALYFKGKWKNPFDVRFTQSEDFTDYKGQISKVRMMNQKPHVDYMDNMDYKVIKFFFGDGEASMYFILPHNGTDSNEVNERFDLAALDRIDKSMVNEEVTMKIPRFRMEYQSEDMGDILRDLGISLLQEKGHLTSMSDNENLFLAKSFQKAVIEVDERGAEAADITAMIIGAYDDKPKTFKADHPFFFIIRNEDTGLILFMGKLLYP